MEGSRVLEIFQGLRGRFSVKGFGWGGGLELRGIFWDGPETEVDLFPFQGRPKSRGAPLK